METGEVPVSVGLGARGTVRNSPENSEILRHKMARSCNFFPMMSVASIWQGTCELTETNAIKNNTHNIQSINIYESEDEGLGKALNSEVSPNGFPTSPDTVSKQNAL